MRKKLLTLFILLLSITLIACGTRATEEDDPVENEEDVEVNEQEDEELVDEDTVEGTEDDEEIPANSSYGEGENVGNFETDFSVDTGETEEVNVEGDSLPVKSFTLNPYNIVYRMEEVMGEPSINEYDTSTHDNGFIKIAIDIIEDKALNDVVAEQLEGKDVKAVDTTNANNLVGKGYDFDTSGFVAYEVNDNVLLATYEYTEGSDERFEGVYNYFKDSINLTQGAN